MVCAMMMAPHLANAQIMLTCAPSQNRIIQVCDPDLVQFDSDSVQAYLAAHSMPTTDASTLFQYARTDLRNELRAFEFARLLDIVLRAPVQRDITDSFKDGFVQSLRVETGRGRRQRLCAGLRRGGILRSATIDRPVHNRTAGADAILLPGRGAEEHLRQDPG